MLREIDSIWDSNVDLAVDLDAVGGNIGAHNEQSLDRKLASIVVDNINFEDEVLEDVVSYLNFKSKE